MATSDTATSAFDIERYEACVFDLDGTVWLGATDPIPGAAEFLDRLRARNVTIAYATNAIVHSPDELSERLVAAGIAQPGEPVVTSGLVITRTLAARGIERVAAVVPPALHASLVGMGIEVVSPDDVGPDEFGPVGSGQALVMASFRQATVGAIERLGRLAHAGHQLFVSSKDPGVPITGGIEPGGGVLLAALTTMYDIEAKVLGKPSVEYADAVADAVGGRQRRIAMFGDSQRSDIGIARELGADGILLTGHAVKPVDPNLPEPTFVAPTLADPILPFEAS